MAVALATEVYFSNDILRKSGLTSDHGKLEVLNAASIVEIEDIIHTYYCNKDQNTDEIWAQACMAVAKKCQSLKVTTAYSHYGTHIITSKGKNSSNLKMGNIEMV